MAQTIDGMRRSDWEELTSFIYGALEVKSLIQQVIASGKKQVSIEDRTIKNFIDNNLSYQLWARYGYSLSKLCPPKIEEE